MTINGEGMFRIGDEVSCGSMTGSGPFLGIIRGQRPGAKGSYAVEVIPQSGHQKEQQLHDCRMSILGGEVVFLTTPGTGWWVRPDLISLRYEELKYNSDQMVDDEEDL